MEKTICTYSNQPLCPQCKGAVYQCDPSKNTQCEKSFCEECGYTTHIEYAKNFQPLCTRNSLKTREIKMSQNKNSFDLNSEVKNTPHIVKVDGVQLFSADWVFEQMQAQSCRIDRSNKFALLGIAVGVVAVILAILL